MRDGGRSHLTFHRLQAPPAAWLQARMSSAAPCFRLVADYVLLSAPALAFSSSATDHVYVNFSPADPNEREMMMPKHNRKFGRCAS
jgi:hypothetical protein